MLIEKQKEYFYKAEGNFSESFPLLGKSQKAVRHKALQNNAKRVKMNEQSKKNTAFGLCMQSFS
ncbi:MAG: hypothetical protein IJ148_05670 [Bacteroidaceae bacterium]|nr:hypothetical protein [Bacteroidaceae bacterium]